MLGTGSRGGVRWRAALAGRAQQIRATGLAFCPTAVEVGQLLGAEIVNMKATPPLTPLLSVIDAHTGGEPARLVLSGLPEIPGATMAAKKRCSKPSSTPGAPC